MVDPAQKRWTRIGAKKMGEASKTCLSSFARVLLGLPLVVYVV